MESQDALNLINRVLSKKEQSILNDTETKLFVGIWEGKKYDEIAAKLHTNNQYARELGSKLFKKINQDLGIIVSKRNFQNPIKYFSQEYSSSPEYENQNIQVIPESSSFYLEDNQNPFIPTTGRIEKLDKLFGREAEIKQIFELLNSSSSVAIIGEPQIGKSSLLYAVYQKSEQLLNIPRQKVFLDMNNIYDQEEFYFAICDNLSIPESQGYRLNKSLKNKRVLLILDNVGKLNGSGFTRDVRDHLRGLCEDPCLKLVVAASESLKTLFNDSYETSPLADICQQVDILPWSQEICDDFIFKRLQLTNVTFTDTEIQDLIQASNGHPQKLTQLCYDLYKKYSESIL